MIKIVIVYDNNSFSPNLIPDWGFSAYIERGNLKILFDTGANGKILVNNLRELEIPIDFNFIVLSHHHYDHTGGLNEVTKLSRKSKVIYWYEEEKEITKNIKTKKFYYPLEEQVLILKTENGDVILTGCAHFGIENLLEEYKNKILLLIGGFHLFYESYYRIYKISELMKEKCKYVVPCHCTGENAVKILKENLGERCIEGHVGLKILIDEEDGTIEIKEKS